MIVFEGARHPVSALAFHPDGTRLAAAGWPSLVTTFWDVRRGIKLAEWSVYNQAGYPDAIQFHPSGRWLLVAGGGAGLVVVDTVSGAKARCASLLAAAIALAPSGDHAIAVAPTQRGVSDRFHSFRTGDLLKMPRNSHPLRSSSAVSAWSVDIGPPTQGWYSASLAFFPDGEKFASAEYRDASGGPDIRLRVRSAIDGSILDMHGPNCRIPQQVAVSPDGVWVVLRAAASLLIFHETDAGKSVKLTSSNRKHLTGIAFHPGGRFLAATSNDATVRFHDRDAGWEVTKTYDWNIGKLKSVAFSPDGTLAAAGSETGKVVVWDVDV